MTLDKLEALADEAIAEDAGSTFCYEDFLDYCANPATIKALIALVRQQNEVLLHVGEYWNGSNSEEAMHDALMHIDDVTREALAAFERFDKGEK